MLASYLILHLRGKNATYEVISVNACYLTYKQVLFDSYLLL